MKLPLLSLVAVALLPACNDRTDEMLYLLTGHGASKEDTREPSGEVAGLDAHGGVNGNDADTAEPAIENITWTDSTSGQILVWQRNWGGTRNWNDAEAYCEGNQAGLPGTGWRMPDISELRSLIRGCAATTTGGTCNVSTDGCLAFGCRDFTCDDCSSGGGPANGCYWNSQLEGDCTWFWSTSFELENPKASWLVDFDSGGVGGDNGYVENDYGVRCVRPGP